MNKIHRRRTKLVGNQIINGTCKDIYGTSHLFSIADFSHSGVKAVSPDWLPAQDQVLSDIVLTFGDEQIGRYQVGSVRWVEAEAGSFGISFDESSKAAAVERKSTRFELDPLIRPIVSGNDPFFVSEKLHFVVEDISLTGCKLVSSGSNRHLLKGSLFKADLTLPLIGIVNVNCRILWIKPNESELRLGVTFEDLSQSDTKDIIQFILFSRYSSIKSASELTDFISSSSIQIRAFKKAIRTRLVETEQDFMQMLELRKIAYQNVGKLPDKETALEMRDAYDDYSYSVGVFLGSVMVGTYRFTYSKSPEEPLPFEECFPNIKFNRQECTEGSRMAILPKLQDTDVLLAMFESVSREIAFSQRNLFILSTKAISSNYKRLGAKAVSGSIQHPNLKDETLTLYCINWRRSLMGIGTSGLAWEKVIQPVYRFFRSKGLLKGFVPVFAIRFRAFIERMLLKIKSR